jgi:hypothetical protein
MQAVGGTALNAETALGALLIVDDSQIIHNGNSPLGTSLFAFTAGNTSVGAIFARYGTLFVIATQDKGLLALEHQMDDALRTGTHAQATAHTEGIVYLGNTVYNRNSVYGASGGAVTTAETAVGTSVLPTIEHGCRVAGLDAVIYHLIGVGIVIAVTSDYCNQVAGLLYHLNAKQFTNLGGGIVGAGDTEVGSGLALCESLCILITAGIAAGATVDAREASTEACNRLIYLYMHKVGGNSQEQASRKADATYN